MKSKQSFNVLKRVTGAVLALVMLLGLLPVSPHVHAEGEVETGYTITFYKTNVREHGEHVTLKYTAVDNPKGGEKVTLMVVPDGDAGDSWFAFYYGLWNMETDYTDMEPVLHYTVAEKGSGFSSNWPAKGGFTYEAGDYTVVVFDDKGTDNPATYITFTITRDITSETVITEATCDTHGKKHVIYADGNEGDLVIPMLGHQLSTWGEVAGTDTHFAACSREGCDGLVRECKFEDHVCTVCGGKEEFYTDKITYAYGEPIMVTSNYHGGGSWVGLYKAGDPTDGISVSSLFWINTPADGVSENLLSGEQQRHSEYVAGDYKVVLFNDGNYSARTVVYVTITTEIDESKTVTVPATCEKDGSVTYYNTDGTVARVDVLASNGHDYDSIRPEFDSENLQHTFICNNDNSHTKTENCSWDDGEITLEPTDDADGIKTFTCTVCGGTKTEAVSSKVIDHEELGVPPTCEEPGTKIVHYTDGTSQEIEVPKLNHDYSGDYVYNGDKTHSLICKNDETHKQTADCNFAASTVDGGTSYTCSVCGGSYSELILTTDKAEYAFGESIIVTVNADFYDESGNDWVALYKKGEKFDPDNGGVKSIYWYYISDTGCGAVTDINWRNNASVRNENDRDGEFGPGEYTVALLTEHGGNWYWAITSTNITIGPAVRDESKTVRVEPSCEEDGSISYFLTDGTPDGVVTAAEDPTLAKLGHDWSDWAYVEGTENHSRVCARDLKHRETKACSWDEGVESKAPTADETGEMLYTCSVCGGTKTEIIPVLTATETGREIFAPTCTDQGYTLITYSDGSTRKVDFVSETGHNFGGEYTRVPGTHTHSQKCQNANCDEVEISDCKLETNGVVSGDVLAFACPKCGEWEENIILTDKDVYAFGEDIIVTINPSYKGVGSTDWIGLYKAGERPNVEQNPTSIRWNYAPDFVSGKSIFTTSNHDRPNDFVAGDYLLYLCLNDGYEVVAKTAFKVTTEIDESKTVRVEPTCDADGTITYYNTDGTVNKVVTAAEDSSLASLDHMWGEWSYNGDEKQTHTHKCTITGCDGSETEACEWDEGVVTLEPTEDRTGTKTYTCNICYAKRNTEIPKVNITVTGTETVESTCEAPGYTRTFYSDGTYSDEVIPAKGHKFGDWTFDLETKSHKQICANDAAHVIEGTCEFTVSVADGSATHTCSVCEGSYVTGLMETDKLVYGVNDPIFVTVYETYSGAWVGLYKEGEYTDPNNGGVASLYWDYVTQDMVGKPFDLISTCEGHRGERLSNGNYVLRLFGDSGYTSVIDEIALTVFTDMSDTEFGITFKGVECENGYSRRFKLSDVDNPGGGEKVSLTVSATGEVGTSWVGIYEGKYTLESEFVGVSPKSSYYISDANGYKWSLNWPGKGPSNKEGFAFAVGHYTIVIFEDGSAENPVMYITFEVYRPTVSENIILPPRCEIPGLKDVVYEDDGNDATPEEDTIEIEPIGHAWAEEWTCVEGTNTHAKVCANEAAHVKTESCNFENGVCTECGGIEYHIHEVTFVPASEASCSDTGNIEYYVCECGAFFEDAEAKEEITDKTSVIVPTTKHPYGAWQYNELTETHTRVCNANTSHVETEPCTFKNGICTECFGKQKHVHALTFVEKIEPTCLKEGNIAYYTCECGAYFLDEDAKLEITDKSSVVLGTVDHAYGEWKFDAAARKHTKVCSFNSAHVISENCSFDNGVVTKAPTSTEAGIKTFTCSICKGTYTETILPELSDGEVVRIYGMDRYKTAYAVADQLKQNLGVAKFQNIVVTSGNDFADALAGNYLASVKNAPILLVRNQNVNDVKAYINKNLAAGGTVYLLGGTKAVPAAMETGLDSFKVVRLGGATRYETNLLVLKEAGVAKGSEILVCTGKDFADGLSASAVGKPILLVKDSLTSKQIEFLSSTQSSKLYIIGGKNAVSDRLATALAKYGATERIDGATRYQTSANIAKKFFSNADGAVLVYGQNFPDALCGGVLANKMNAPVIMVANGKQAPAVAYAKACGIKSGYVLGGPTLIKDSVVSEILK